VQSLKYLWPALVEPWRWSVGTCYVPTPFCSAVEAWMRTMKHLSSFTIYLFIWFIIQVILPQHSVYWMDFGTMGLDERCAPLAVGCGCTICTKGVWRPAAWRTYSRLATVTKPRLRVVPADPDNNPSCRGRTQINNGFTKGINTHGSRVIVTMNPTLRVQRLWEFILLMLLLVDLHPTWFTKFI